MYLPISLPRHVRLLLLLRYLDLYNTFVSSGATSVEPTVQMDTVSPPDASVEMIRKAYIERNVCVLQRVLPALPHV